MKDLTEATSLHLAVLSGKSKKVKVRVGWCKGLSTWTDWLAVQAALDDGADIEARDRNKQTPLHYAALVGRADIMKAIRAATRSFPKNSRLPGSARQWRGYRSEGRERMDDTSHRSNLRTGGDPKGAFASLRRSPRRLCLDSFCSREERTPRRLIAKD